MKILSFELNLKEITHKLVLPIGAKVIQFTMLDNPTLYLLVDENAEKIEQIFHYIDPNTVVDKKWVQNYVGSVKYMVNDIQKIRFLYTENIDI